MVEQFRERVLSIGTKGLDIIDDYFSGKDTLSEAMVREAASMVREAVKISNRDQVDAQVKRSQAIKLISFIPQDKREEYIASTNPEVKPYLLLQKPKK